MMIMIMMRMMIIMMMMMMKGVLCVFVFEAVAQVLVKIVIL